MPNCKLPAPDAPWDRREFLGRTSLAAVAAALPGWAQADWKASAWTGDQTRVRLTGTVTLASLRTTVLVD